MKRIIVVGTSASGKTTFARKLSQTLNITHIQLDQLFWGANWSETSDEEFFQNIMENTNGPEWIVDGNYGRTNHITWPKADTIIWIDLPFWLTVYQSLTRAIIRTYTQQEIWPGTGNKEDLGKFFSKDSVFIWMLKTYHTNRKKYLKIMKEPKLSHLKFIHLKSRREIREFLLRL